MIKELTATQENTTLTETHSLILFNDEVNSFDWVIKALVEVCDQSSIQAEQCAWIVHFKGKYSVMNGSKEEMIRRCIALLDRGLSAEVQDN